jgi:putative tryptophan/tyrosine transport system substrate-binding protein
MKRRSVLLALSSVALAPPSLAQQRQKVPLIVYLSPIVPQNGTDFRLDELREGLREHGYKEGDNIRLETRWGEGRLERMPALASEVVKMRPDVIVAASSPAVAAAHQATRTIPIVFPVSSDPVAEGFVASLAHPGGNMTGLSTMAPELGRKRMQLLKDVLPAKSRAVGVMWNPAYKGMSARFEQAKEAAPNIRVSVRSIEVRDAREMEAAFDAVRKNRPDGLLLLADPLTLSMRARIVEFAREERLPAIYEISEFVEAGGLMSYGHNLPAMFRRAAYYVDRILKGAKPDDLPIEQPVKIELYVNLRTARDLGLTIPSSVLVNADKVIR